MSDNTEKLTFPYINEGIFEGVSRLLLPEMLNPATALHRVCYKLELF